MRERLIKLLKDASYEWDCYLSRCFKYGEEPDEKFEEFLADYLLQDDVIVAEKDGESDV